MVVPAELGVKHDSVSHPELRRLYGRAALVAVTLKPNLHISGATSILEAMACERPVVVTAYTGYEEYVADGETGVLVPPGDEEAFAAAMRDLLGAFPSGRERSVGLAVRRLRSDFQRADHGEARAESRYGASLSPLGHNTSESRFRGCPDG